MIIRKPYLFFAKHIRLFNIILLLLTGYLVYNDDKIVKFLNRYIDINDTNILVSNNINAGILVVIPVVICFICFILLGVMFRKKKPFKLYVFVIFSFIAIIVINIYVLGFFDNISREIVAKRYIKLARDFKLITIIIETLNSLLLFIRSVGFNIKKFDFSSDIYKFDSNDEDDETEVSISFDSDRIKKNRKIRLNKYKYFYKENKFKFNIVLIVIISLFAFLSGYFIFKNNNKSIGLENVEYSYNDFYIKVNKSYYSNKDYLGNIVSDNYLIIIDVNLKGINNVSLNEFKLNIGGDLFSPTNKYYDNYTDLGNGYNDKLNKKYMNYILIFEVPKKYINKKISLNIYNINIKLDLVDLDTNKEESFLYNLGDKANINNYEFIIDNYELSKEFIINYEFCYKNNDCINSIEHLRGSINENYDKVVLKLSGNLNKEFYYNIFNKYSSIVYTINDTEYVQNNGFELIDSKNNKSSDIYIAVNSDIINADNIKLVFNVRNIKVEYMLGGRF